MKSFKKVNFIFLSNGMPSVCHSYVIRISLVCSPMASACHSYVLVCDLYVTRMYSHVIRMSLVCTCMWSVCHSYVLVSHPYVTYTSFVCNSSVVLPWTFICFLKFSLVKDWYETRRNSNFYLKIKSPAQLKTVFSRC